MVAVFEGRLKAVFSLFDFPHEYPIRLTSFKIPGLGSRGPLCGHQRMDAFSEDGSAVRYGLLRCKRIECPSCWPDWARRVVFSLVLRIEAYARATGQRPYSVVMSVPPHAVKDRWNWDRVNTSLFRRGYRRIRDHGVDGGVVIFHPYRIKDRWKANFRAQGIHRDIGMWKVIRERVQDGDDLFRYVKLGPHLHGIVFGDPQAHECTDYVIRFNDGGSGKPKELDLDDLIGLLFYLISHTGVLSHLRQYANGVQRRKTHTIRGFGSLFRIRPSELLPPEELNALASEIASRIGMVWRDGRLDYPASCKELGTTDDLISWVPIRKLGSYLVDDDWLSDLSEGQRRFWLKVWKFIKWSGRPPDPGDVKPPPDVQEFYEEEPDEG